MSVLDRNQIILDAQDVMLSKFKIVVRNELLFGKECIDLRNDVYLIYTGLLALRCENILTEEEEVCVLAKLQTIQ